MTSRVPALIVHGGAGADPTEEPEELREGIAGAVEAGWRRSRRRHGMIATGLPAGIESSLKLRE